MNLNNNKKNTKKDDKILPFKNTELNIHGAQGSKQHSFQYISVGRNEDKV